VLLLLDGKLREKAKISDRRSERENARCDLATGRWVRVQRTRSWRCWMMRQRLFFDEVHWSRPSLSDVALDHHVPLPRGNRYPPPSPPTRQRSPVSARWSWTGWGWLSGRVQHGCTTDTQAFLCPRHRPTCSWLSNPSSMMSQLCVVSDTGGLQLSPLYYNRQTIRHCKGTRHETILSDCFELSVSLTRRSEYPTTVSYARHAESAQCCFFFALRRITGFPNFTSTFLINQLLAYL